MQTIAVISLIVAAVALAVAAFAVLRLGQVKRQFAVLWGEGHTGDVAAVLARQDDAIAASRASLDQARAEMGEVRREAGRALRHVALVRYDAFGDMAGRLSFSAALLDDAGDGVVLSSIHTRGESRTYAKTIAKGSSESELSIEEKQAVTAARTGKEAS